MQSLPNRGFDRLKTASLQNELKRRDVSVYISKITGRYEVWRNSARLVELGKSFGQSDMDKVRKAVLSTRRGDQREASRVLSDHEHYQNVKNKLYMEDMKRKTHEELMKYGVRGGRGLEGTPSVVISNTDSWRR